MKTYRLLSSTMFCTPGVLRWAINGAKFKKDQAALINIFVQGFNLPEEVARKLLLEEVPYTVEDDGETVVFTA